MLLVFISIISLLSCNDSKSQKNPELSKSIERGAIVYEDFCMQCHLPDGKGVPKAFPPLDNADFLMTKRKESIKAIKYGLSGEIVVNGETYNTAMAPLGLTDEEVADVMNYITNSWSNKNNKMITIEEVSKIQP
ncbi:cytochrome c [Subsaxibacter sp. CAU 1640]|uniref:c-type cytochrome n=1 Tax=Subsaxibacter sp. CAU 1640 TaxID=2933271 RepID=UPI002002CECD|nr:cytochrome c [Subsaxibacter sp. CAU 1640]MCK7591797.1 cytochrome c [Subsaxibacter sp. CAU 1640]